MNLQEILNTPGTHVWLFKRMTNILTVGDAHRRLSSALQQSKYARVVANGVGYVLTSTKDYMSEPVLVITVTHKEL